MVLGGEFFRIGRRGLWDWNGACGAWDALCVSKLKHGIFGLMELSAGTAGGRAPGGDSWRVALASGGGRGE